MMYTLTCTIYVLIIFVVFLNKFKKRKISVWHIGVAIAILLGVATIFYEPFFSDDLYRINQWLDELRKNSIDSKIYKTELKDVWLQGLYYRILIMISDSNKILGIVTIFIEILTIFGMYNRFKNAFSIKNYYFMNGILIFLGTWDYFIAASNIRYLLAGAVFIFFLYLDFTEEVNLVICFIVYISLCFFHQGMIIPLGLRIGMLFINKEIIFWVVNICLIVHRVFLEIIGAVLRYFPGNLGVKIMYKFTRTVTVSSEYSQGLQRWTIKLPLAIAFIVLIIFFIFFKEKDLKLDKYVKYLILLSCFALGATYEYDMFNRHMMLVYIMVIPIYCLLTQSCKEKVIKTYRNLLSNCAIQIVNIMTLINFIYLFLIQYKHFSEM